MESVQGQGQGLDFPGLWVSGILGMIFGPWSGGFSERILRTPCDNLTFNCCWLFRATFDHYEQNLFSLRGFSKISDEPIATTSFADLLKV